MPSSRPHRRPRRPPLDVKEPRFIPPVLDGNPRLLPTGEHPIHPERIDPVVLRVVRRLAQAGFLTLIVGGAPRDLMMGRLPKDFDLATTARPEQILRLFPKARIIGRRFRLVLLRIGDLELEIATFRTAGPTEPTGRRRTNLNQYGTPHQDALRRDFGVNALGYDPRKDCVVDYVGGLADLEQQQIRTISPPERSFAEDPVRMLRAVRFQVRLGFHLHPTLEHNLRKMAGKLREAKRHRTAEETQRFLTAGQAQASFARFHELGLLEPLLALEAHAEYFHPQALASPYPTLQPYLRALDTWAIGDSEPVSPTVALLGLLVSLARAELVAVFTSLSPPPGKPARRVRTLLRDIPHMLGKWGLLKGQVMPAMQILTVAHELMGTWHRDPQAVKAEWTNSPQPGLREAWWLLILLREVLDLPQAFLASGRKALPDLPPLPILDHHQPWRVRSATQAHLRAPVRTPRDFARRRRRRRKPRTAGHPA